MPLYVSVKKIGNTWKRLKTGTFFSIETLKWTISQITLLFVSGRGSTVSGTSLKWWLTAVIRPLSAISAIEGHCGHTQNTSDLTRLTWSPACSRPCSLLKDWNYHFEHECSVLTFGNQAVKIILLSSLEQMADLLTSTLHLFFPQY